MRTNAGFFIGAMSACALALAWLLPRTARADDALYMAADWPFRLVDRPLVLTPGMFEFRGDTLRIDLTRGQVGDSIALAPDLHYGVDRRLTVGIDHTAGICISGDSCASYGFGIDALYSVLHGGPVQLAAYGSVQLVAFDPLTSGYALGMASQVRLGDLAVVLEPRLYLGLVNRDEDGRKESLDVPVKIQFQLTEHSAVLLTTGLHSILRGSGASVQVPVGLGTLFALDHRLDLGLELLFPNLAGADASSSGRLLIVRIAVRL